MLYWFLLFFPVVLYYLFFNKKTVTFDVNKKTNNIYFSLISIVLISFVGLRHVTIGMDTLNYYFAFFRANNIEFFKAINSMEEEWGYLIFQKLCGRIKIDFTVFCIMSGIVSILPVIMYIKKYSPIPALSLFFYIGFAFYTFTFSGIRQGLAIGMCSLAAICIHRKRFIYYCIFVFLAIMFHKTAMIFIPAYWMSKLKLNKFTIFIMSIVAILTYYNRQMLFEILNENARLSYEVDKETGGMLQLVFMILNALLGILLYMREMKNNEVFKFSFLCIVASICIMVIIRVNPALMRLYYYYYIFIILYIPHIIRNTKEISLKCIFGMAYIFVAIYFYNKFVVTADIQIMPYKFFWS